jgi:hypothetical protein
MHICTFCLIIFCRNESEAIKDIVENITRLLDKTNLFIANNPVGIESRVRDMIQLLDIQQSSDVLLLGMWGIWEVLVKLQLPKPFVIKVAAVLKVEAS